MSKVLAQLALPILKELKQRDAEYWANREAQYALPVRERDFDWQSYCRHGAYIGDPYGADYLCGACEDGASVYDEAIAEASVTYRRWLAALDHLTALVNLRVIDQDTALKLANDILGC
jgi:hypothetical protein